MVCAHYGVCTCVHICVAHMTEFTFLQSHDNYGLLLYIIASIEICTVGPGAKIIIIQCYIHVHVMHNMHDYY